MSTINKNKIVVMAAIAVVAGMALSVIAVPNAFASVRGGNGGIGGAGGAGGTGGDGGLNVNVIGGFGVHQHANGGDANGGHGGNANGGDACGLFCHA